MNTRKGRLESAISVQTRRAVMKGVHADTIARAATATRAALRGADENPQLSRRAEAYFWAVVRRTLVRRRTDPHVTARFVLEAVVEDLRASGRDDAAVWGEIEHAWAAGLPAPLLEEYRLRLSA